MKIIIEGYPYCAEDVRTILNGISTLESRAGTISINYVGYYYNPTLRDYVFILPKVLLDEQNKVFSRYNPHEVIDIEHTKVLTSEERSFVYEFAVWIYRAIAVYGKQQPKSDLIYQRQTTKMGQSQHKVGNTLLEIILALLRFAREQKHFFIRTLRQLHSGYNKINWERTITRTTAWVEQNTPIYHQPINQKRHINTDEELIVIYFSILQYISHTYGFPTTIAWGLELIRGRRFDQYIKGYGKHRLRQIKYRYFSDVYVRLWQLCYAFFEQAEQSHTIGEQSEYLLSKNFNIIFEAIIDHLIGDNNLPNALKAQEDGKRIDHIYRYHSLITNQPDTETYYIGDSKYYKIGNPISKEAVYKQFTYARNLIQWNINLFLNHTSKEENLRKHTQKIRDDQTEGYNIVPNFFISAKIDEALSYSDSVFSTNRIEDHFISRHFENRLFDRDTLLVYHYDVNFLYIVSLYARDNTSQQAQWRHKVRAYFRENIQMALQEHYVFYVMMAKPEVEQEEFISSHFQMLVGKVYRPYSNPAYICLALEKDAKYQAENEKILTYLHEYFFIERCDLGENPDSLFQERTYIIPKTKRYSNLKRNVHF